jgi:hypothetical protein
MQGQFVCRPEQNVALSVVHDRNRGLIVLHNDPKDAAVKLGQCDQDQREYR